MEVDAQADVDLRAGRKDGALRAEQVDGGEDHRPTMIWALRAE
jgi:hypothetical protein